MHSEVSGLAGLKGFEIVLLSVFPQAHVPMIDALRRRGATVRLGHRVDLGRAMNRAPACVLVDLVHGAGLTRDTVAVLNRRRGRTLVVALHDGHLQTLEAEAAGLAVQGFCRASDWLPLLHTLAGRAAASPDTLH